MKFSIDQLAKSVLQKDTLAQCSNQELQQLADQYPYFGAAHLLFAKKMFSENNELNKKSLQGTSLFFYNPLWLEHLLNDKGNAEIIPAAPVIVDKGIELSIADKIINAPEGIAEEKEDITMEQPENKSNYQEESLDDNPEILVELPAFKIEPFNPHSAKPIFEPFHTVDYFASLGIKFKEEALPQDKFGKQLKSFTEWLKTLKKLPESPIEATIGTNIEQKVEQLASESIQDRDVITEAMADVWEKQGNPSRAIEIYNKLSLLDASKRPYFAAKIEELKKIN